MKNHELVAQEVKEKQSTPNNNASSQSESKPSYSLPGGKLEGNLVGTTFKLFNETNDVKLELLNSQLDLNGDTNNSYPVNPSLF